MPSPGRCLLQLHAVNQQGLEAFRLTQLRALGQAWSLQLLDEGPSDRASAVGISTRVGPEAAATQHFVLTPISRDAPEGRAQAAAPTTAEAALEALYEQGRPTAAAPAAALGGNAAAEQQQWRQQKQDQQLNVVSEFTQAVDLMLGWEATSKPGEAAREGFHTLYQQR